MQGKIPICVKKSLYLEEGMNGSLLRIKRALYLLSDLAAYLVGEVVSEFGEGFMIEHTPDYSVVECDIAPLEFDNAFVTVTVLRNEEAEIWK